MKIRPVGADLFHGGGQTGMTKLIVAFSNFCERNLKEREAFREIIQKSFV